MRTGEPESKEDMDKAQRIFFRLHIENAVLKADGNAFQVLFEDLMEKLHGGVFERVRPYGNLGDRKCDGYLRPSKTVFQCYAPREMQLKPLLTKMSEDFHGAKKHWDDRMECWRFVHNDPAGLPADAVQMLQDLEKENPGIDVKQIPPSDLIDTFLKISAIKLSDHFGPVPSMGMLENLSFEELQPVLRHIAKQKPADNPPLNAPSPEKLEHNGLSDAAAEYLSLGRKWERLVERYFAQHPEPDLGDRIAEGFRQRYASLKDMELSSDDIFSDLQAYANGKARSDAKHEAAVMAVISYFFERCDIFEDAVQSRGGAV